MYTWLPLASSADVAQLAQQIDAEYAPNVVAKKIADGLSGAVKAILIERNYIDKDSGPRERTCITSSSIS